MTKSSPPRLITPNLAWFMITMILANTGSMMSLPLLSVYLTKDLDASVTQIGIVFTLANLVPLILQIFGGWLSDSMGRLRTIALGAVVATIGYTGFIIAPNWQWLAVALMLEFVSGAMVGPSFSAYIADQTNEKHRAKVFGITSSLYTFVGIIGPPLGGHLADTYGFSVMLSVSAAIYGTAAIFRIWMAFSPRFREKSPEERAELLTWRKFKSQIRTTFALFIVGGLLTWILIIDGARDIASRLSDELIPVYYATVGGLDTTQIGQLSAISWIGLMIFTYVGGWLADKYSERLSIVSGFFMVFTGYVILLRSSEFLGFAISRAAFGVGWGLMWPAFDSLISKAVPVNIRGLVFGMFGTSLGLISLPAPYIGGKLWDLISPQFPLWITGIVSLVAIIPAWFKFKLPEDEGEKE
jgi:MFS family permease